MDFGVRSAKGSLVLRVLLVGPQPAPPFRGGVEKGVDLLLRTMLAAGTRMRVFDNYRTRDPHRPLWERLLYQLGMLRKFHRELLAAATDLVHVKTSSGINFYQNTLYALVARLLGYPVVFQIHCGKFESFYRSSHPLLRAWIRHSLAKSRGVVVLSESLAQRMSAIVPTARIIVVPNGLGDEERDLLLGSGRRSKTQVLFMGAGEEATNREKGLDDLLAVLPELTRRFPDPKWVLAGLHDPLNAREQVRGVAGAKVSGEPWIFRGIVEGHERVNLLKESSILVLPSYFENMPNILLEAMASGMGVVATSVGAVPEMLGGGEGGILISPGDRQGLSKALGRMLASPGTVQAQGARNRSIVEEKYSMSVVQERLERTYREALGLYEISMDSKREVLTETLPHVTPGDRQ